MAGAPPQHPVDPTRTNTKVFNSLNNERLNYKIGPEGQFIPNNWMPVKYNNLRRPNANTNALRLYNLNAQPFNVNANNQSGYNYEFGGLTRKILRSKPDTPRDTITHWAEQVKDYWRKSKLNTRVQFTDRERRVIDFILGKPDAEIELETLKSFVRALVVPSLQKAQGGRRRITKKRRSTRKQTRRRRST